MCCVLWLVLMSLAVPSFTGAPWAHKAGVALEEEEVSAVRRVDCINAGKRAAFQYNIYK